ERDRDVSPDGRAHDPARVRVEPRRHVEREDRRTGRIQRLDGRGERAFERPIETRAEQRVDDDVRHEPAFSHGAEGHGGDTRIAALFPRLPRVTAQPLGRHDGLEMHGMAGGAREPGDDVAVAGIVARAADHGDLVRVRPPCLEHRQRRAARAAHQRIAGNAALLDRDAIESAYLRRRVDGCRQGVATAFHRTIILGPSPAPGAEAPARRNPMPRHDLSDTELRALADEIRERAVELGFAKVGVTGIELRDDEARLRRWLELGRHGELEYMERHGMKRARPAELVPGTVIWISARMDVWLAEV